MIQTRTAPGILGDGIDQAIRLGAPSDMIARLRGALAFANIGRDEAPKRSTPAYIPAIPPMDAGAVQDE